MDLKPVFERSLKLIDKEYISIDCVDKAEVEAVRTRLYAIRREYSRIDPEVLNTIKIIRELDKKRIILMKIGLPQSIRIHKPDGQEEDFIPDNRPTLARIVASALQDGMDRDFVISTLSGLFTAEEIKSEYDSQLAQREADREGNM